MWRIEKQTSPSERERAGEGSEHTIQVPLCRVISLLVLTSEPCPSHISLSLPPHNQLDSSDHNIQLLGHHAGRPRTSSHRHRLVTDISPKANGAAGPLVFATFVEHYLTPKKRDAEGKRTAGSEDLMYDEGELDRHCLQLTSSIRDWQG